MNNKPYPKTLVTELAKFGKRPTGDAEWDACILQACRNNRKSAPTWLSLHDAALRFREEAEKVRKQAYNLADPDVYSAHSAFVMHIANNIVLAPQRRKFIVDDNNRDVLRFLLYYFNNCPLAEEVFPGRGYKLHKSILIQGGVGVGKTLLMQIFSEYLQRTNNPRFFWNLSVTQMVNYYTPFTTTSTVSPTTRRSAVVSSATLRTCASTTSAYKTAHSSAWTLVSSQMSSCTLATRFGRSTASLPTSPQTSTTTNFKSGSSAMTVSAVSLTVSKLTT